MMNTYLAKQLHDQIVVEQKSKEFSIKKTNTEDLPKQLKHHYPHINIAIKQQ